jgi:hypothetical protein
MSRIQDLKNVFCRMCLAIALICQFPEVMCCVSRTRPTQEFEVIKLPILKTLDLKRGVGGEVLEFVPRLI